MWPPRRVQKLLIASVQVKKAPAARWLSKTGRRLRRIDDRNTGTDTVLSWKLSLREVKNKNRETEVTSVRLPFLRVALRPFTSRRSRGQGFDLLFKVRSRRSRGRALLIISHITTNANASHRKNDARHFFLQNTCKFQKIVVTLHPESINNLRIWQQDVRNQNLRSHHLPHRFRCRRLDTIIRIKFNK